MARRRKRAVNLNDQASLAEHNNQAEDQASAEARQLIQMLDSYPGRAYIWRLLERCGVFSSGYQGEGQPFDAIFRDGRRSVGQEVLTEILTHYPRAFTLMQTEAVSRANNED